MAHATAKETESKNSPRVANPEVAVLFTIWESTDGQFRGSYEEVLAYEEKTTGENRDCKCCLLLAA